MAMVSSCSVLFSQVEPSQRKRYRIATMIPGMTTRRSLTILGSTGSIGTSTLDVLRQLGGRDTFDILALTGADNVELLAAIPTVLVAMKTKSLLGTVVVGMVSIMALRFFF